MGNNEQEFIKYECYSTEDFLADPYFQEWVYSPTAEGEAFWKEFANSYPYKQSAIDMACQALLALSYCDNTPTDEEAERALQKHLTQINHLIPAPSIVLERKEVPFWKKYMKIAALLGGLALLATFLVYMPSSQRNLLTKSTGYGESKTVVLPDGSQVKLNANSSIRFAERWGNAQKREIWLKGEAWFNVIHLNKTPDAIKNNERFIVHTDHLDVNVLGTTFDVRTRRKQTEVVLEKGRIEISFPDTKKQTLMLAPGEMLSYSENQKTMQKQQVNAQHFNAWTQGRLQLHDPSLNKIISYLEDNYGKHIILIDPKLGNRRINGPILLSSLDDALFVISGVLQLNVQSTGKDTILLRAR